MTWRCEYGGVTATFRGSSGEHEVWVSADSVSSWDSDVVADYLIDHVCDEDDDDECD